MTCIIISSYYAADNSSIYFVALDGVKVVTGINAKTIKRFPEDSSYLATEDAVFYRGLIMENAKPQSFEIIKYSKNNFTSTDYSKDKNHVYHAGAILKDADPATFEDIGEGYAKDKDKVYYNSNTVKDADVETIQSVSAYQAEDSVNIYRNGILYKKK